MIRGHLCQQDLSYLLLHGGQLLYRNHTSSHSFIFLMFVVVDKPSVYCRVPPNLAHFLFVPMSHILQAINHRQTHFMLPYIVKHQPTFLQVYLLDLCKTDDFQKNGPKF